MTTLRALSRAAEMPGEARIDQEILLVEDQRSLALTAAKMLHERWGCRVLIATSLEQVKQIIAQKERKFFLAISDLNLPDAPDGEVIDALIAAKIPTIAITGAFDRKMLDKFMSKGIIDYVLKSSINAYEYIVNLVGRLYKNLAIKVLVVDDSEGFCQLLTYMLKLQNLQVLVAHGGDAALKLLDQHNDISLVLVDYNMRDMDGLTLLASIRRKFSMDQLGVIGISGSEDRLIAAQFLKLGANDYLAKPFSYEELVTRVSHHLQIIEGIEALRYVAYHDYLTGLLNRRAFFEQGAQLQDKAAKASSELVVAMMDIDFFKKVNDSYGHDGGDAVLKHFALLLSQHFADDLLGRLGGEEFALIFADDKEAMARCEKFRQHVEKAPALFGTTQIPLTISIGLTRRRQANLDATLKLADENLYKAKQAGRNRIVSDD